MARPKSTMDSGGGRKSEVITIRLDPRLKYLAELAARRQRRPLSSYVEWAIEQSLERVYPGYDNSSEQRPTFAEEASSLWDVDEADRFANLALNYPELLTHEEQLTWKLIRECGLLWRGEYKGPESEWRWTIDNKSLLRDRLRAHFGTFVKVGRGQAPAKDLPTWLRTKPKSPADDMDDEIPF